MTEVDTGRFTVGVFQNAAWAQKGLDAIKQVGLTAGVMTIMAKDSPEIAALIERTFGAPGDRFDIAGTGTVLARGSLVAALQGSGHDLPTLGLSGTMRRVGFQAHDARIYEVLTGRGGVLVAVQSESRVSDVLEVLLSYGGGNAAIGAWTGRV